MTAINQGNSSTTVNLPLSHQMFIYDTIVVATTSGNAITTSTGGVNSNASLFNFGMVAALDSGYGTSHAIEWNVAGGIIYNAGTILAADPYSNRAISINTTPINSQMTITNVGEIIGGISYLTAGGAPADPGGGELNISNSGTMIYPGDSVANSAGSVLRIAGAVQLNLNNSGRMEGDRGIVVTTGGNVFVQNSGEIVGTMGVGISSASRLVLNNSGLISSSNVALDTSHTADLITNEATGQIVGNVYTDNGADVLTNHGVITGDVFAGSDNDTVVNDGVINGILDLGNHNDIYRGFGGTITGELYGGSGDDTFYIDQGDLIVDGGSGTDTLFARSDVAGVTGVENIRLQGEGDFSASGDGFSNDIRGNVGSNLLSGQDGDDKLYGLGGDDTLRGGNDNDTLVGGDGDDVLNGGAGVDFLRGGRGADVFEFFDITDSGTTGSTADRIVDFVSGEDRIDLTNISYALEFVGAKAFAGGGQGSVRYTVNAAGHSIVDVDVDGDGVLDMRIMVTDTNSLDAGDFIL